MTSKEAKQLWLKQVYDKQEEIDENETIDWWDMAYGFFLGLGFEPNDASNLANEVPL